MGKSKQVGNIHITINKKTEEEKREEREKLFEDIENVLIPIWLEKSKVNYTLDEKKKECYKEIIKFLYSSKAIYIPAIKEIIERVK